MIVVGSSKCYSEDDFVVVGIVRTEVGGVLGGRSSVEDNSSSRMEHADVPLAIRIRKRSHEGGSRAAASDLPPEVAFSNQLHLYPDLWLGMSVVLVCLHTVDSKGWEGVTTEVVLRENTAEESDHWWKAAVEVEGDRDKQGCRIGMGMEAEKKEAVVGADREAETSHTAAGFVATTGEGFLRSLPFEGPFGIRCWPLAIA